MIGAEYEIRLPNPSWQIIGSLFLIAGASVAVFSTLVRRWTTRRQWVSLTDWSKQRRLKFARAGTIAQPPAPLDQVSKFDPQIRISIGDDKTTIIQFDTMQIGDAAAPRLIWNVLIRKLAAGRSQAPAGLRPANLPPGRSVIDLFALTPF